jgi:DNA-binding transcriptional LysR family regulator
MQRMNWDDLRVFLAVVQARNVAEAARDLGVNRSTLSRRITALEETLGARLFLRTREGLRLSPAGERLRTHVERMAVEAREIATTGLTPDDTAAGVVTLATTEGLASRLVQLGLLELRKRYPELVIEILTGNRPADLAHGEADLALRVLPPKESQLRARRLIDMKVALYAAPGYLRDRGLPRSRDELDGHDAVVPCGELGKLPEALWLSKTPGVRIAFRSNNFPALVAAAAAGLGVLPLTMPWGEREPRLTRLFELADIPPRQLWLVTAADAAQRAAVRVVAEAVRQLLSSD